jgi:integral membrane sensor domain MASE1
MSLAPIVGGIIGGVVSHWLQKIEDSAPSPEALHARADGIVE